MPARGTSTAIGSTPDTRRWRLKTFEDGAFIEPGAAIARSLIGKDTFVGQFANIEQSLALGDTLVQLESGSHTRVPDRFLLCALRQTRPPQRAGMFARLTELCNTEAQWIWKNLLLNRES